MRVLVIAPHNDDETLGEVGAMAMYARKGHEVYVCEATSGPDQGMADKIKAEALKAHAILGVKETIFLDLPVVALGDMAAAELNEAVARAVSRIRPEIAFIPHRGDLHGDHKETAGAAMVALRPIEQPQLKALYAYETLSETEWNTPSADNAFLPNHWIALEEEDLKKKLEAFGCYQTQVRPFPHPRSPEAVTALARLRGSTVGECAAESFMVLRQVERGQGDV